MNQIPYTRRRWFLKVMKSILSCYNVFEEASNASEAEKFVSDVDKCVSLNLSLRKAPVGYNIAPELEVAFRMKLLLILDNNNTLDSRRKRKREGSSLSDYKEVYNFIHFAAHVASVMVHDNKYPCSSGMGKIPVLLLEDYFHGQPVQQLPLLWHSLISPLTPMLTKPELFKSGQSLLLRFCNEQLRRLSRACDTEVCGRIKMFLAASFPINEKSAINLIGRHNAENRTTYEQDRGNYMLSCDTDHDREEAASNIDDNALPEKQAPSQTSGPLWRFRLDRSDYFESSSRDDIEFDDYYNFWALQDFLVVEPKSQDGLKLLECCKATLALLERVSAEGGSMPNDSNCAFRGLNSSLDRQDPDMSQKSIKYLTSPDLLPLQIRDLSFRRQVVVQILIACQSLRIHYRNLSMNFLASNASNGNMDASGTDKDVELHDESTNSKSPVDVEQFMARQFFDVEERCFNIIKEHTNGNIIRDNILRVLWEELQWAKWKQAQCPGFAELASSEPVTLTDEGADAYSSQDCSIESILKRICGYEFNKEDKSLHRSITKLCENVANPDDFLQEYIDADDPACGIEEEYHPKHDSVYCWRARRLLVKKNVRTAKLMNANNDLSRGLTFFSSLPDDVEPNEWVPIVTPIPKPRSSLREDTVPSSLNDMNNVKDDDKQNVIVLPKAQSSLEEDSVSSILNDTNSLKDEDDKIVTESTFESCSDIESAKRDDQDSLKSSVSLLRISRYSNLETQQTLRDYFSAFGKVKQILLVKANKAKKTTKHALIQFEGAESANRSVIDDIISEKKHVLNSALLHCEHCISGDDTEDEPQGTNRIDYHDEINEDEEEAPTDDVVSQPKRKRTRRD